MSKFQVTKEQAEEMQRRVSGLAVREPDPIPQEDMIRRMKRGQVMVVDTSAGPAITIVIDIDPIGAPRQTRRDAWDPSPAVQRYRAWKDKFRPACEAAGWTLGPVFRAEFEIAMPASWSKKKKTAHLGALHHQKPDIDNLVKSVMDLYGTDDGHVSSLQVTKRWAEKGRIILYL